MSSHFRQREPVYPPRWKTAAGFALVNAPTLATDQHAQQIKKRWQNEFLLAHEVQEVLLVI
jgi:hypothetical protein